MTTSDITADLDTALGGDSATVPVFFLSDSTGISAETMGNAC